MAYLPSQLHPSTPYLSLSALHSPPNALPTFSHTLLPQIAPPLPVVDKQTCGMINR